MIFNGNPLLRFDGYYILADLIEIPHCDKGHADPATICRQMVSGHRDARYLWCSVLVDAKDATTVYIEKEGRLDALHVRLFDQVKQGALLADLSHVEVEQELLAQESIQREYQTKRNALRRVHRWRGNCLPGPDRRSTPPIKGCT